LVVNDGLGELRFDFADRGEVGAVGNGEGVVQGAVFSVEDQDMSGEAVAAGVEGRDALAGIGAGAGGTLGISRLARTW